MTYIMVILGERLNRIHRNWEDLRVALELIKLIKIGYRTQFESIPSVMEPMKQCWTKFHPEIWELVRKNINGLLSKICV